MTKSLILVPGGGGARVLARGKDLQLGRPDWSLETRYGAHRALKDGDLDWRLSVIISMVANSIGLHVHIISRNCTEKRVSRRVPNIYPNLLGVWGHLFLFC